MRLRHTHCDPWQLTIGFNNWSEDREEPQLAYEFYVAVGRHIFALEIGQLP
jgi:hypothetical protein